MTRKSSFANLRSPTVSMADKEAIPQTARPVSREGRKQIAGFFSPDMSFSMHTLARRQGRSLQALMAESFNDILRKYGESPIGD